MTQLAETPRTERLRADGLPSDLAVVMVASAGLKEFVTNTIGSVLQCGISPSDIYLFHSDDADSEYGDIKRYIPNSRILQIGSTLSPEVTEFGGKYSRYGSQEFSRFTVAKWLAVRWLLQHDISHVIYTDIDIAWIRSPINYLRSVMEMYDFAIQSEALCTFPSLVCTGFMSIKNTQRTKELIDILLSRHVNAISEGSNLHDQQILNLYLSENRHIYKDLFLLPEAQFPNGLLAGLFADAEKRDAYPASKIGPMVFHANWCKGLNSKREMLIQAGLWRPGEWAVGG